MKRNIFFALSFCSTLFFASCSHKVTRIDPSEQVDISGRWNNTDSRLVAEDITRTILGANWLTDHMAAKNGQRPVVIVGFVSNKSHEHIEAETFVKDVENSFVTTQKVLLVQVG